MDAFDVLGLAPRFELDPQDLERRYRDLQRALHPDRFAKAPASERRASLARAVNVNDAYRTLRDELKRAELVLARHGGAASDGPGERAEPLLLMEVMELREQLADTKESADVAERARLVALVEARKVEATSALRDALAALSADAPAAGTALVEARAEAARALSRLRYYRRFLDEVGMLEDALD